MNGFGNVSEWFFVAWHWYVAMALAVLALVGLALLLAWMLERDKR